VPLATIYSDGSPKSDPQAPQTGRLLVIARSGGVR
jgi:hypothetical protein